MDGKWRSFCGDKEEYIKYLKQEQDGPDPYIDPDKTYIKSDSAFYKGLIDFLMAEKKSNDTWEYFLHSEYVSGNEYPAGMWVTDASDSDAVLYLRSDQFGFSAPNGKKRDTAWDKRYPYASFIDEGGEESFAADCIWDTRTLGGSFLWPLTCTDEVRKIWKSMYNINRGVGGYIEDSVDLTLYEIKRFYDLLKEPYRDNQSICETLTNEGCILLRSSDKSEICKWLKHFHSFEEYIDYFCFQPFVNRQYHVIDITKAKLELDEKEEYEYGFTDVSDEFTLNEDLVNTYRKSKRIAGIKDRDRLRQILTNVRMMTLKRTKGMEKNL